MAKGSGTVEDSKTEKYAELLRQVEAVLADEDDPIAWMATLACLIQGLFGFLWVGFYRVRGKELIIGPYQGTLGCLRIPFERGVCGACAKQEQTMVVEDVHAFPGHISCDARSRAEIVVPVLDDTGCLRAVLDIDSDQTGTFDEVDREGLERLVSRMKGLQWTVPS
jgi:L-methionine (R)-S-oxide reductase